MDAIGNEVGQKMRSAIKAKLMELGSYVDDELPDYIMVMVANKRTKSQMESDLQLFLRANTKVFVEWLQQVLKKLKEVRLTNPEMYAELKRKASIEMAEVVVKKEKNKRIKLENSESNSTNMLLSDNIPVNATTLVENICSKPRNSESILNNDSSSLNIVNEDSFDIPSISEVNLLEDSELEVVADKIKKAKIALLKSDSEDEDFINIGADTEELLANELSDISSSTNTDNRIVTTTKQTISLKRRKLSPDTKTQYEEKSKWSDSPKSMSDLRQSLINSRNAHAKALEAKANEVNSSNSGAQKRTICLTERLREEKEISGKIFGNAISKLTPKHDEVKKDNKEKKKSVHSRLGPNSSIASMVSVPKRKSDQQRQSPVRSNKSIQSMVQVKPRKPSGFCQANKALLLKAVAEAQRSVSQVPSKTKKDPVEEPKSDAKSSSREENTKESRIRKTFNENKPALFTKKYKEQHIQKRKLEKVTSSNENQRKNEPPPKKQSRHIIVEEKIKSGTGFYPSVEDDSNDSEYEPKFVKKSEKTKANKPSSEDTENVAVDSYMGEMDNSYDGSLLSTEDNDEVPRKLPTTHQFIVTLDGIKDKLPFKKDGSTSPTSTTNIGDSPKSKRPPSPIIFDKKSEPTSSKPVRNIPDSLPKVAVPKERCKFWPSCRLGEKCEFSHPNAACKVFPNCKFGDRCIYIHPKCKFFTSCTRKDCPYSHIVHNRNLRWHQR